MYSAFKFRTSIIKPLTKEFIMKVSESNFIRITNTCNILSFLFALFSFIFSFLHNNNKRHVKGEGMPSLKTSGSCTC